MSIKSTKTGYAVDVRPQGRNGKRHRKTFKTKAEAQQYERWIVATQNNKGWIEKSKDTRKLTELIDRWFDCHGQYLKDGSRNYQKLKNIAKALGDIKAFQLTALAFSNYRSLRVNNGISVVTINRDQMLLSGVFTALIKTGEFQNEHPLKNITKLTTQKKEMTFLSKEQINKLLNTLTGDASLIAKLCLSTGARWSEAATLNSSQVVNHKVTFVNTKNGKNRTIPITDTLFKQLKNKEDGLIFNITYKEFYDSFKLLDFKLAKGQAVHVLRHTFASHFVMNGGNILILQRILGHGTINQTMTYAHLAPDHLQEAITYNPLSTF